MRMKMPARSICSRPRRSCLRKSHPCPPWRSRYPRPRLRFSVPVRRRPHLPVRRRAIRLRVPARRLHRFPRRRKQARLLCPGQRPRCQKARRLLSSHLFSNLPAAGVRVRAAVRPRRLLPLFVRHLPWSLARPRKPLHACPLRPRPCVRASIHRSATQRPRPRLRCRAPRGLLFARPRPTRCQRFDTRLLSPRRRLTYRPFTTKVGARVWRLHLLWRAQRPPHPWLDRPHPWLDRPHRRRRGGVRCLAAQPQPRAAGGEP